MNPEEGRLRPQIMDRFGLRVMVRGLQDPQERLEAYRRVQAYTTSPRRVIAAYAADTAELRLDIQAARQLLPQVELPDEVAEQGLKLVQSLHIDSLRAEITLFESARAYAAADGRQTVTSSDLAAVTPMALCLRRSPFMEEYLQAQKKEAQEITDLLQEILEVPHVA